MTRQIRPHPARVTPVPVDDLSDNVRDWLQTKAKIYGLLWLLAHAEDGVNWGHFDGAKLILSNDVHEKISPPLKLSTLWQARLFDKAGELLLWKDGEGQWQARLIRDAQPNERSNWEEAIDEDQILWGTDPTPTANAGFTLISDGAQGLRHVVPLTVNPPQGRVGFDERSRPLRLTVRHYVAEDMDEQQSTTGFTRIVASRLVEIKQ